MSTWLFARETRGGKREYVSMTPEQAWQATHKRSPAHLYEVLTGPCHMYIDIEWKLPTKPEASVEQATVGAIVDRATRAIEGDCNVTKVTASGKVPGGQYKCSWHVQIRVPGVAWASANEAGAFVKKHLSCFPEVDLVPYKAPTQNWRCVGSAKFSEPSRVFQPVDRDTFMGSLVHAEGARTIIGVPLEKATRPIGVEHPVVCMFENVRPGAAHWASDEQRYLIIPFLKQVCPIAGRQHRSNHQFAVVDTRAMRWKLKCHKCDCTAVPWQPMPDFDKAKSFIDTQEVPAFNIKRVDHAGHAALSIRARGPPPLEAFARMDAAAIQCSNGVWEM